METTEKIKTRLNTTAMAQVETCLALSYAELVQQTVLSTVCHFWGPA